MISFRFHLVSLVAVFLALGLGVLTGTTVLNRGIVRQLENNTDRLAAQAGQLRADLERLEAEVAVWSEFGDRVMGPLVENRLLGTDVVLVTQQGVDTEALGGAREALAAAGASLRREISIDDRMSLMDAADRESLAEVLGAPGGAEAEVLLPQAADALADQLAFGPSGGDLIQRLEQAGFLAQREPDPLPEGRTRPDDPLIVVVAGADPAPELLPAVFLVPLVERLVLDGQSVAASEAREVEQPFVTLIRENGVAVRMVTQDNVDGTPGGISLVLALEALLEEGEPGHYGVKGGASQLMAPLR